MERIAEENEAARFHGFYRAVVKDNEDPKMYGRVRLEVSGVFDLIETKYLPWAVIAGPMFCGSGPNTGSFNVPDVGTHVWCFFEEGDHNQPVYFAEATDGANGLPPERTTNYPNRRVIKTKAGICIYVDDTEKEIKVTHPTGSFVAINADGKILAHGGDIAVDGINITVDGVNIDVNGTDITVDGAQVTITGGIVSLTGGTMSMTGGGGITIQGPVDIN